jgi:hypothetical protein
LERRQGKKEGGKKGAWEWFLRVEEEACGGKGGGGGGGKVFFVKVYYIS